LTFFSDQFDKVGTRLAGLAGVSVTYTPIGGSGVTVTAVVSDLPDDDELVGRRFNVAVAEVAAGKPGDLVTDSDGVWRVFATGRPIGGRYELDCEIHQERA